MYEGQTWDQYCRAQDHRYCPEHEGDNLDSPCEGPHCDECGEADVNVLEWCGACGCCLEHCQREEDCPPTIQQAITNYLAAATAWLSK